MSEELETYKTRELYKIRLDHSKYIRVSIPRLYIEQAASIHELSIDEFVKNFTIALSPTIGGIFCKFVEKPRIQTSGF